jgi:hypothetical protein
MTQPLSDQKPTASTAHRTCKSNQHFQNRPTVRSYYFNKKPRASRSSPSYCFNNRSFLMKPPCLRHRPQEPDISPGTRYEIHPHSYRFHFRYPAEASSRYVDRNFRAVTTLRHVVGRERERERETQICD